MNKDIITLKMKPVGIAFKPYLVDAIKDGVKTVTRRLVKGYRYEEVDGRPITCRWRKNEKNWAEVICTGHSNRDSAQDNLVSWLESDFIDKICDYHHGRYLYVKEPLYKTSDGLIRYHDHELANYDKLYQSWKWKPDILYSMFMPKWAARTWLRVVSRRVEFLDWKTLTDDEAIIEGIDYWPDDKRDYNKGQKFSFLWDSINKKQPFESRPLVRRIEFEVVDKPKDDQ